MRFRLMDYLVLKKKKKKTYADKLYLFPMKSAKMQPNSI